MTEHREEKLTYRKVQWEPHAVQQKEVQNPTAGREQAEAPVHAGAAQMKSSLAEQELEVLANKLNMLAMDTCDKSNSILPKNYAASRLREGILPLS